MAVVAVLAGIAIMAGTFVLTAVRYPQMPERVPIHFGIDGTADSYGPRQTVWLLVALQLLIGVLYLGRLLAAPQLGEVVMADCLLAILAWAQFQVTDAAVRRTDRISASRFWIVFAALLTLGIIGTRLLR